ncbi:MAG: retron system putative HNH endonuclease, partial [Spirulinaceae cyanobacterium]
MKFINKGNEPEEFAQWKELADENWQPSWNNLQKKEKPLVHEFLLKEQGYICCYCGRQIGKNTSHIEHLKPRKLYPNLALNYNNMLASCKKETAPKEPQHCGVKKGDWYDENLMISPLSKNCGDFFIYTDDGQMLPSKELNKQVAAATTIDKLGLNIDLLQSMRSQAIESI